MFFPKLIYSGKTFKYLIIYVLLTSWQQLKLDEYLFFLCNTNKGNVGSFSLG